ncbi:MAG: hypothetical protein AB8C84_10920 [Oligoflexales bacterium]
MSRLFIYLLFIINSSNSFGTQERLWGPDHAKSVRTLNSETIDNRSLQNILVDTTKVLDLADAPIFAFSKGQNILKTDRSLTGTKTGSIVLSVLALSIGVTVKKQKSVQYSKSSFINRAPIQNAFISDNDIFFINPGRKIYHQNMENGQEYYTIRYARTGSLYEYNFSNLQISPDKKTLSLITEDTSGEKNLAFFQLYSEGENKYYYFSNEINLSGLQKLDSKDISLSFYKNNQLLLLLSKSETDIEIKNFTKNRIWKESIADQIHSPLTRVSEFFSERQEPILKAIPLNDDTGNPQHYLFIGIRGSMVKVNFPPTVPFRAIQGFSILKIATDNAQNIQNSFAISKDKILAVSTGENFMIIDLKDGTIFKEYMFPCEISAVGVNENEQFQVLSGRHVYQISDDLSYIHAAQKGSDAAFINILSGEKCNSLQTILSAANYARSISSIQFYFLKIKSMLDNKLLTSDEAQKIITKYFTYGSQNQLGEIILPELQQDEMLKVSPGQFSLQESWKIPVRIHKAVSILDSYNIYSEEDKESFYERLKFSYNQMSQANISIHKRIDKVEQMAAETKQLQEELKNSFELSQKRQKTLNALTAIASITGGLGASIPYIIDILSEFSDLVPPNVFEFLKDLSDSTSEVILKPIAGNSDKFELTTIPSSMFSISNVIPSLNQSLEFTIDKLTPKQRGEGQLTGGRAY